MFFLSCVFAFIAVILTRYLFKRFIRNWRNEPPGPWGLPIVGYSLYLKPRVYQAFMKIRSEYPDIAQATFGQQPRVLLNSYKTIKEALLVKGDNFAGRQRRNLAERFGFGKGLINSEGFLWKEHRRFAIRALKDFGLGRNRSEEIIQTEIHNLLQILDENTRDGNHLINIMDYLLRSVSNVICTLTMGEQPGYESEEVMKVIHQLQEMMNQNFFTFPPNMFPTLFKFLSPVFIAMPRIKRLLNVIFDALKFFERKIDEHEKCFDPSQDNRDYIETFLREKQKQELSNPGNDIYTSNELPMVMLDLFIAGTDTTSFSLSWGFLLLAIHADVQTRCHEEIDATIGREKQPIMRDKEQMPYIQAVLDEVQRFSTIAPMGLTHRTFQPDTIHGHYIAEDILVVPFIHGVHHDPRVWEKPEEFYPEHFLTITADEKMKYTPREELIPFSIGKRECLGESLAKMELFLFFVNILQKYEIRLPSYSRNELEDIMLGTEGIIHAPGRHQLLFHPRQ